MTLWAGEPQSQNTGLYRQSGRQPEISPNLSGKKHKKWAGCLLLHPLPSNSICCRFTHLLLGNPGHGVSEEPTPIQGTHAASVASCGHTTG